MTDSVQILQGRLEKIPIDIIMPSHNKGGWGLELAMNCIKNIFAYTQVPFHLIIVDDSTDISPLWFKEFAKTDKNVTYLHSDVPYKEGNQFFNHALQHCRYEFVATIMNSIVVQPNWEVVALQMLKTNPKIATIGLKCLMPWGTIESAGIKIMDVQDFGGIKTAGVFPTDIAQGLPAHLLCDAYEREAVQWAFAIHRKQALIGNLEEGIFHGFLGWDDIDNCFVLRKKGWLIFYCGAGVGYHYPRATRGVEEENKKSFQLNIENGNIFRKRWQFAGEGCLELQKPIPKKEMARIIPGDDHKSSVPLNRAQRRRLAKVK